MLLFIPVLPIGDQIPSDDKVFVIGSSVGEVMAGVTFVFSEDDVVDDIIEVTVKQFQCINSGIFS